MRGKTRQCLNQRVRRQAVMRQPTVLELPAQRALRGFMLRSVLLVANQLQGGMAATVFPDGKKSAVLRKTNTDNYIYRTEKGTSFGYFDADGNLKLETYDPKKDTVTVTTYSIIKQ